MNALPTTTEINLNATVRKTGFHRAVALNVTTRPESPAPNDSFKQAIRAALDTVVPSTLKPVSCNNAAEFHPRTLLAVIIVCYVHQIYDSTEIELLLRNSDSRTFSPAAWPDAQLIREFRRQNSKVIHDCLMTALWFLGMQKVKAGSVTKVSEAHFAEEATRRMVMAMFTDSPELGQG